MNNARHVTGIDVSNTRQLGDVGLDADLKLIGLVQASFFCLPLGYFNSPDVLPTTLISQLSASPLPIR